MLEAGRVEVSLKNIYGTYVPEKSTKHFSYIISFNAHKMSITISISQMRTCRQQRPREVKPLPSYIVRKAGTGGHNCAMSGDLPGGQEQSLSWFGVSSN